MVSRYPQDFIKGFAESAELRINFAQCAWPVLALVATVWSIPRGASPLLAGSGLIVSLLPFFAWLIAARSKRPIGEAGGNLLVITWTLVSFASVAIGGGALSPLTLMLALGPLTALALGRPREAMEASVLGGLAYAAAVTAGFLGWAASAPDTWTALSVPWTLITLVQFALLLWACGLDTRQHTAETSASDPSTDLTSGSDLDTLAAPLLLLDVSAQGRVRAIYGPDTLRWPDLRPGRIIEMVVPAGASDMTAPGGTLFQIRRGARGDGGSWVALVPETDEALLKSAELPEAIARAEAAEAALSDRTAFFAGLGHDLKTPLNAILGFADLMKAEVRGPMPKAYQDYPAIIHESGQDLMLLVEDILDLAKAEADGHRLELEPVDLVASGASVIRQLQDQAERAEVSLAQAGDAEVWAEADPRAVRQIWQNLVSNAIKYSSSGGRVTLKAGRAAGAVFLSVRDRGAGMDQADLDRIAEPFAQGDNAKGRAGTGLGLAVVQRFAELHGGRVIIDTAPGKGTRVRVTLPAATSELVPTLGKAAQ